MLSRTTRHLAPLRTFAARQSPSTSQYPTSLRARFSSSSSSSSSPSPGRREEPRSPNAQFYKTFGRPMAKVFLLAVLTYQLAYYFWVRLENNEIKAEMRGKRSPPSLSLREIRFLEANINKPNYSDYFRSRSQDRTARKGAE
ncbi:uncharacterized protein F4812DRAFT_458883 [Daldinia caldariorum]|uniref:uncharacterized protein n=1 Tax=Daldinia caldariorum TaxID=326644 RepID=UPI0020083C68|nr:uncharacterized protein F4812DRAFT_458883 [Daldinia caldariorum]KAI1468449.1 hypothetical protein F4812DRAFT_458883 [Daldinia caldariorum]